MSEHIWSTNTSQWTSSCTCYPHPASPKQLINWSRPGERESDHENGKPHLRVLSAKRVCNEAPRSRTITRRRDNSRQPIFACCLSNRQGEYRVKKKKKKKKTIGARRVCVRVRVQLKGPARTRAHTCTHTTHTFISLSPSLAPKRKMPENPGWRANRLR